MSRSGDLVLTLCPTCHDAVLTVGQCPQRDGFTQLPLLCAECGGKVAQCVRIIVSGLGTVRGGDTS